MDEYIDMLHKELENPPLIRNWKVYTYHFIDVLGAMSNAEDTLLKADRGNEVIYEVTALFKRSGWEGDGTLQILWLVPFVFDDGDTWGEICFHVKQSNNGTSWIASKYELPFKALEAV